MNHTDENLVPGASPDASIMLRHILASLIAGVTTEVRQTDDAAEISVSVISMDTGLKFSFTLPSAAAVATSIQADIVMSDTSSNPAQNKVIKAYVDDKFWTGTAAEYAALEDDTNIICFLSDTNIVMYNGEAYSLNVHTHGNLTNEGAIGTLAGRLVMTGTNGVLETATVASLKELLDIPAGSNWLHNSDFASPLNTAGLTIYNTVAECLDRWSLLGGTLTINAGHATLSQAAINTAVLRQTLPVGSYMRLMGQNLTLSVMLDDDETVYQGSGIINGAATTIMTVALDNGYSVRLVVNNNSKAAYVEIIGGTSVAAVDLFRVMLEVGDSASIETCVTDTALDLVRIKAYDLAGAARPPIFMPYDSASTNLLINGGFDVWQRGTTQTANGYGSDDRWINVNSGSTKTHSQVAFTVGQTDVPNNPTYFSRTVVASGGSASNLVLKVQRVENVNALSSKIVTLSFWAKADASKFMSVEAEQIFGTGGSAHVSVTSDIQKLTLTTLWQHFAVTITIPSVFGKTIGANSSTGFNFWFAAGSDFNARTDNLGNQSGTFDIANVQLNYGAVALPFVPRSFADELRLSQRYFVPNFASFVSGFVTAGSNKLVALASTPAPMRTTPTLTLVTTDNAVLSTGQIIAVNSVVAASVVASKVWIEYTLASTASAHCTAIVASVVINADAEL